MNLLGPEVVSVSGLIVRVGVGMGVGILASMVLGNDAQKMALLGGGAAAALFGYKNYQATNSIIPGAAVPAAPVANGTAGCGCGRH